MAISFRSAGVAAISGIALGTPSGVQSTDVVVAVFLLDGGSATTITAPSGWTLIRRTDNSTVASLASYWALGSVSSYSFTISGGSLGYALAYSGVDTSNPVDLSSGSTGSASPVTASAVTTTGSNDMLLGVFCYDDPLGSSPGTWSSFTTTTTERGPSGAAAGAGAFVDGGGFSSTVALDCAEATQGSAGNSGSASASTSGSPAATVAQLIALKLPAAIAVSESTTASDLYDVYGPFHALGTAFQPNADQSTAFQILGGSTNTHLKTADLSESALTSDALAAAASILAALSESTTASDSLGSAQAIPTQVSESATASDALSTAQKIGAVQSETATPSVALDSAQTIGTVLSESTAASDALASAQTIGVALAESASASDVLASAQAIPVQLSESATATDSVIGALQLPASFLESIVADVLFDAAVVHPGASVINVELAESCSPLDSLVCGVSFGAALIESAGARGGSSPIFVFED